MNEQELLELKNKINQAEAEINQLQGKKELLEKELKDTYGCKDRMSSNQMIRKLRKLAKKIDIRIRSASKPLEKILND
jgi:hypothetical protein